MTKTTSKNVANTRKRFLKDLKKEFPEKKIVLVFVEIRPDAEEKETLVVDGKRMPTCWSPPVAKLDSEDSYQALLDYCTKGIKENKWKKEVKNGKK